MKKRLSDRDLRACLDYTPKGRRGWDPYYAACRDALAYRSALKRVREIISWWACVKECLPIIDRALGRKGKA